MMLWSAILLGLGGSLHCVAMCGPIAMALPLTAREKGIVILQSLLYNFGRISTYTLMGFFFGFMGWGVALSGYQNALSIILGVLLLLTALFSLSIERKLFTQSFFSKLLQYVKDKLANLLSIRNHSSAYRIGLLNGLLPCGLVYVALAGSLATANHWGGALYMFVFGLGTIPLMLAVMLFGKWSKPFFRNFQKWIPYALFLFGVYLIYRGMMLEIPKELNFWEANNFPMLCH
ncbi:MAG TPA: sulfite exporter TauE/SafE family protein [Phaeodactylibacter sp.]|nr:sulfite exporter TauE/SafE family protein [Phaeodactylibacter sp.]